MEQMTKILCTDAAAYMLPASPLLKVFYPYLIHVTCIAHGLKRVPKQIRNEFPEVNSLISDMKKVFYKSPSRIVAFKEKLSFTPATLKLLKKLFRHFLTLTMQLV
jgi:hypothetical protein